MSLALASLGSTACPQPDAIGERLEAARRYLLSLQQADGHWCGELEGDSILESEYVLTMHFLGRTSEPRVRKAAEYIRRLVLPEGGWASYRGGPPDASASVKAYFVLKLLGDDPEAPHMASSRRVIRALGGIRACNSFTRIYLAVFGQCSWDDCPIVPPELVLLPKSAPFSIYRMSSWSRAIVVPLSIVSACRPSCAVPEHARIPELLIEGPPPNGKHHGLNVRFWRGAFTYAGMTLAMMERNSLTPLRRRALRAAERWVLKRLEHSDGLAAIFPPIVNTILAFRALGYAQDDPRLLRQVAELEKLAIEEDGTLRVQPCFSPVWDTALSGRGLLECGAPDDPELLSAGRWLLDHEVRRPGDWSVSCPGVTPSGWYFEYANEFYPDTDDTAEVLGLLGLLEYPNAEAEQHRRHAVARGLAWLFAMQNRDGGWGAFDKECNLEVLTFIPFADHNAMIDPSCEDITGRTLETLASLGFGRDHPALGRAVRFLKARQQPDGTWYGRWGCNYIYGTYLALTGLAAVGEDLSAERYQRAARWLAQRQNPDGGWGELPDSYDDPGVKGQGPSTPSQTAWALMGLLACGEAESETVRHGVRFLLATQQDDGSWKDEYWTGTGFPKVFYLRYHLYASEFALRALARYRKAMEGGRERAA